MKKIILILAMFALAVIPETTAVVPETVIVEAETVETETTEPVWEFIGTYKITGYDICYRCCGKTDGITASGTYATAGRTVAAPYNLPFGTKLYIDGIGYRTVEDRGGAIKGNKIDVLCNNHSECYAITGYRKVWIIK